MEDRDKKFDEMYRKQLANFELPVSDKVLANIKEQVGTVESKRKFGFGSWMISLALIISLGVAGYFMLNTEKRKINENSTVVTKNENVNGKEISGTNLGKREFNSVGNETNSFGTKTNSFKTQTNSFEPKTNSFGTGTNSFKTQTNSFKTQTNSFETRTNSFETRTNSFEPKTNSFKTQANSFETRTNSFETRTNSFETKTNSFEKKSNNNGVSNNSSTDNTNQKAREIADVSSVLASSTEKENKEDVKEEPKIASSLEIKETKIKETKKDTVAETAVVKMADTVKKTKTPLPIIDDKPKTIKKTNLFAGINGGASFAFRTLTTGNNTGANNRNNESSITTYNAGIEVGASIKSKLLVSIGVRLSNYGEKYNGSYTSIKTDTTLLPIYDSSLQIIGYYDSLFNRSIHKECNVQNNYQFLSIPLMIGYKLSIGEKWFVAPCIGVGFNYLLKGSSTWVDAKTGEQIDYVKANNFNSTSFSADAKLEIGYTIKNKWSVVLQPGYTRWLQSIYKKDDEIKLMPYSYNVNLGIRYSF